MRFSICSAAYPQDPAYVADFMGGVAAAAQSHPDTELVLAVEHGYDAVRPLVLDRAPLPVRPVLAERSTTPARLRGLMLAAAAAGDSDLVVFTDFDDRLEADALELHAAALGDADISYGDMIVTDAAGRPDGPSFFENADVPDRVDGAAPLLDRNFMGFTNTAVRRAALVEIAGRVPESAVAVDWWLFTMLLAQGRHARRTADAVVRYRQHAGSTLGARAAKTLTQLRNRALAALGHYRLISETLDVRGRRDALERLIAAIDQGGIRADGALSRAAGPGVWFDDVRRARDAVAEAGSARTTAALR